VVTGSSRFTLSVTGVEASPEMGHLNGQSPAFSSCPERGPEHVTGAGGGGKGRSSEASRENKESLPASKCTGLLIGLN